MVKELRSMGFKRALIRTLIFGVIVSFFVYMIHFAHMTLEFEGYRLHLMITYGTIALIFLIAIIINWVWAFKGGPLRGIRKFCAQSNNPEAMMARIEKVWNESFVTENCRIDDEYFVYARKMKGVVIRIEDIIGIWYEPRGRHSSGGLDIYLADGTEKGLVIGKKAGLIIQEHIMQNTKDIAVGRAAAENERDKIRARLDPVEPQNP